MQTKRSRWSQFGLRAVVSATTASFGLAASALTLAPIKVESALGQNFSAEIELLSISADELSGLKLNTASPTVYAGMGMEFNPAIGEILLEVVSKSNGGRAIKLRSARPLTEPFVDLVLEISSPTGKLIRPYRLLLDPPRTAQAAAASAPVLATRVPDAPPPPAGDIAPEIALAAPVSAPKPSSTAALAPIHSSPSPADAVGLQEVIVKRGDTAGKIAADAKPRQATLEQMLLAMLQANPTAFAQSNVNRLQEGALLTIPDTASILKINPQQARSLIHQQGLEFGLKQAQQERYAQEKRFAARPKRSAVRAWQRRAKWMRSNCLRAKSRKRPKLSVWKRLPSRRIWRPNKRVRLNWPKTSRSSMTLPSKSSQKQARRVRAPVAQLQQNKRRPLLRKPRPPSQP